MSAGTEFAVVWVDPDPVHARAAQAAWGARFPAAPLAHCADAAAAESLLPVQPWAVVVLCLRPDAALLPPLLDLCAGRRVLLCIYPDQEGLAARGFRQGLSDYALRAGDGSHGHLGELLQRVAMLVNARRAEPGAGASRTVDARVWQGALQLLQEQRSALQATLASMSQGIFKTDPAGRITVYNQRVLELLRLPEALMASRPTLAELTRVQAERGEFGQRYGLVDARGKDFIAGGAHGDSPALYWRDTPEGRTLEVRTTSLPDGSIVRTFADVSDFVRIAAELRDSEARFRSLSDLSSDWYWEQDEHFRFVPGPGNWSVPGSPIDGMVGHTRWEVEALNMAEPDWARHRATLAAHQPFRDLELQRRRDDGSTFWISVSGVPLFDADGRFRGYRGVGRDISERKHAEGRIEQLAFFDVLTGLPNRRLLFDRVQRALAATRRSQAHGALLFIDLDNFKTLNDTEGHDIGDQLLVQVAQRLQGCVRACDTVARFGGDEFVVVVENLSTQAETASTEASTVAQHIVSALGQPYALGPAHHHSTPSIGIALFHQGVLGADELLKYADLAMYQAKGAGRNTVRFFDPAMQAAVSARSALETDLRRAIVQRELVLHYQPVVDVDGRLVGAEALSRWTHPQRGPVSPGEFIPLAEQTGLILPLGQWVIETACAQLVEWRRSALTRALFLSVNVSVRQFRQPDFVEQLLQALHASGANPERLKLELTESLLLSDAEDVVNKMHKLRSHGVGFSLDDFGTGYSSLAYLKRLPLEQIKIDQGFVRDVLTDPNDAAIVRTILMLARSLDIDVVAEGVETTGQADFLKRHGCRAFQGYLFGRPMPAAVLERALRPAL